MTVRSRPRSQSTSSIGSTILWIFFGLLVAWLTLAAVAGLVAPAFAAAGP